MPRNGIKKRRRKSPIVIKRRKINYDGKKTKYGLSGYEPKYEPDKWNLNPDIKYTHNCYAYLLNKIVGSRGYKPQPGYFSGYPPLRDDQYNCYTFLQRLRRDIPSFELSSLDKACPTGKYKGFLAIDDKKNDPDYHFYRQNSVGTFSHKPGRTDVVNYDASGKKIYNPLEADRHYKNFNYSKPCFFFCLNSKLARTSGKTMKNYWNY